MSESDRLFVHRPFHLADPHRSGRSVGRRAHRRRQLAIEPSRCSTMAHAGRGPPRRHRPGTRRAGRSRLVAPDPGASDHRLRRAVGGGGAVECSVGGVSLDAPAALAQGPPRLAGSSGPGGAAVLRYLPASGTARETQASAKADGDQGMAAPCRSVPIAAVHRMQKTSMCPEASTMHYGVSTVACNARKLL